MGSLNEHLLELLEDASIPLPGVTRRRMFGSEAMFVDGRIYALVWNKEGRLGVKLTDPADREALLAVAGAESWSPGGKAVMQKWVLLPESFHDDQQAVAHWVRRAHAQQAASEKPPAKRRTATRRR